jgi:ABC-type transporter Mla MlaB component
MLRITIFDMPAEQRLVLEGRLTEPWVSELESTWEKTRNGRQCHKCVVDLSGTTVIDESGKRILMVMCSEGARFVANGVATIHLIRDIKRKCAQDLLNASLKKP